VERIDLGPDGQMHIRLNVVAADLSCRHKSDDFNSFLMHLFFWRSMQQKDLQTLCVKCGVPTRKYLAVLTVASLWASS